MTPRYQPNHARAIEVLAFPGVQLLDVAGPIQVFASTNDLMERSGGVTPYALRVVAPGGAGVVASAGLGLAAAPLPGPELPVDTLLVAGGQGVAAAASDPVLVEWLRMRAGAARRAASVCTGAFLLAATGLLDGRRAATHWTFCAELARLHPAVRVEEDPIFVQDGPVWTSAGVTAGIDLALALVEEDLGRALALDVARHLVMFLKRPGGQSQFSAALMLQQAGQRTDDRFGKLHDWIRSHLSEVMTGPLLAEQAGMSERSFSRRYMEATGMTPGRAVERLRVEAARQMLSDTRSPVKRIAMQCGFGSEETMRRSFLRQIGVTPQEYRSRFGA